MREKRRWENVRKKGVDVLNAVYRQDERAAMDWNTVVAREAPVHRVVREPPGHLEACKNEYLLALMNVGGQYSCEVERLAPGEDGAPQARAEQVHFHLLDTAHSHHRPRTMPTIHAPRDTSQIAPLAFQVQMLRRWQRQEDHAAVAPGCVEVIKN